MRRHPLPGFFGRPEVREVLATWGVHTLADLVPMLPEEIMSLPGATYDTIDEIGLYLALLTYGRPPADHLSAGDLAHLDTVTVQEAKLSLGSTAALKAVRIATLGDVARTAPLTLDAIGLSLDEQRRCIWAIPSHQKSLKPRP
jgi:hypothetical protein